MSVLNSVSMTPYVSQERPLDYSEEQLKELLSNIYGLAVLWQRYGSDFAEGPEFVAQRTLEHFNDLLLGIDMALYAVVDKLKGLNQINSRVGTIISLTNNNNPVTPDESHQYIYSVLSSLRSLLIPFFDLIHVCGNKNVERLTSSHDFTTHAWASGAGICTIVKSFSIISGLEISRSKVFQE